MTTEKLEQFMVDYHKEDDMVLVNSRWLQSKLTELTICQNKIAKYEEEDLHKELFMNSLKEKLSLYKDIIEVYRKIKVLDVTT